MSGLIADLGRITSVWLEPNNALRQNTVEALRVSTGLNTTQIEMALSNCFEELTTPKLDAYWTRRALQPSTPSTRTRRVALHILPANVFTAWVPGVVLSLLCGYDVILKPSTREPIFARAWADSLKEANSSLVTRVAVTAWGDIPFSKVSAAVAYGSDESLRQIQAQLPTTVRWVGYGQKMSVGVIYASADAAWTDRVRQDLEAFNLNGCLSPQVLMIEESAFNTWKGISDGLVRAPEIRMFHGAEELAIHIQRFSPHLSAIGVAGLPHEEEGLKKQAITWGVSRVCAFGSMQRVPLDWQNSGVDLVNLLN